mmetsp:Transcript_12578/g.33332  ORF Transcript_12578/g.33332 Transcript_12578/m.33332 type:complete len:292 (-) Transcript_12578:1138-2013(-)
MKRRLPHLSLRLLPRKLRPPRRLAPSTEPGLPRALGPSSAAPRDPARGQHAAVAQPRLRVEVADVGGRGDGDGGENGGAPEFGVGVGPEDGGGVLAGREHRREGFGPRADEDLHADSNNVAVLDLNFPAAAFEQHLEGAILIRRVHELPKSPEKGGRRNEPIKKRQHSRQLVDQLQRAQNHRVIIRLQPRAQRRRHAHPLALRNQKPHQPCLVLVHRVPRRRARRAVRHGARHHRRHVRVRGKRDAVEGAHGLGLHPPPIKLHPRSRRRRRRNRRRRSRGSRRRLPQPVLE